MVLINTVVANNVASSGQSAGGIWNEAGELTLIESTVIRNEIPSDVVDGASAIYCTELSQCVSNTSRNSIVVSSTPPTIECNNYGASCDLYACGLCDITFQTCALPGIDGTPDPQGCIDLFDPSASLHSPLCCARRQPHFQLP